MTGVPVGLGLLICHMDLDAFNETEFNEMPSGRRQRRNVYVSPTFQGLTPPQSSG